MVWPAEKVAFVTGAASGIGQGMARALVEVGAKVVLCDIDAERLEEAVDELISIGGRAVGIPLDVSDPDQWTIAANRAEELLGPVSILCNNAGVCSFGDIDETSLDIWRWVYRVNIEGQFIGTSTFLPRFKKQGGRCHIVNTASMAGMVPMARVAAYSSAKFASVGFTMALRDELQGSQIGVSLLCPGNVATRIAETSGSGEARILGREINLAAVDANKALSAVGADPKRIGEQVVEAMQKREFLIVTHSEWGPIVKSLQLDIQRTFDEFDGRHGQDVSARVFASGANPITT